MSKEMMEVFTLDQDGNRVSTGQFVDRGIQVGTGYYIVGVNN